MCLRMSHLQLLTQNNLWGSVMPCGHNRCVMLVLVSCISKINNFHVRILQGSLIPLLQSKNTPIFKNCDAGLRNLELSQQNSPHHF